MSESPVAPPDDPRPYKCRVDVTFPTALHAKRASEVLSVDNEIGDKTARSFSLISAAAAATESAGEGAPYANNESVTDPDDLRVMRVHVEAAEARLLRVSMSTFYDLLNIVLKCFREFGDDDGN
mmetsp:Transcript_59750/g.177056  ORF Transcript_59750/g.177056 Transcript_59750/m.177056 type:complete len:124 (-) Transcript_59750:614-985(-)|eukprot:CAMPEP_0113526490 /NCGR_PEP_ID=MMETSP0015_2-20120614/771_1 /TAXON_ID=2838 /ORGANISM="Odontella" /LENGTH=123 /DNA_ID=CAMNT_0000424823 /DNA_START=149 /DNA_END=520 /DNA_ORIENTATION=+ /assembly_acc=CAM_ASM_000160